MSFDLHRETVKISSLSSGRFHKYQNLTSGKTSTLDQNKTIEPAGFTYSPIEKNFERMKTI